MIPVIVERTEEGYHVRVDVPPESPWSYSHSICGEQDAVFEALTGVKLKVGESCRRDVYYCLPGKFPETVASHSGRGWAE